MSDFKYKRSRGSRDSRTTVLHDAVCDKCGKDCKVPFRPSGEKPIYCSDCFGGQGGRDRGRSRGGRDFSRGGDRRGDRGRHELGEKLDKIIELLSSREKCCCCGGEDKKPKVKKSKLKKKK